MLYFSAEAMNEELDQQKKEIRHRIQKLRRDKPLPPMKGRTVIITDDGIGTGSTLFATIELCEKKEAEKIVVAVPFADEQMERRLRSKVDEVIILENHALYHSFSHSYQHFHNLTDEEALSFMDKGEEEYILPHS